MYDLNSILIIIIKACPIKGVQLISTFHSADYGSVSWQSRPGTRHQLTALIGLHLEFNPQSNQV